MVSRLARLRFVVLLSFLGCAGAPACSPAPAASVSATAPVVAKPAVSVTADASVPEVPRPNPWPYQTPVVVRGEKGMVTTDNAIATNVGRDVLAAGGNAADAAVATAFALAVAYPTAGNIGGGGFAVTRMGGELRALDFRETAPAAATRDMYLSGDGKPKPEARDGIKSAGVPGSVAGLWELHRTLGSKKLTWAQLLAPAIKLAEEGFVVDEAFLSTLEVAGKRLGKHPVSAALFLPGGAPPRDRRNSVAAILRKRWRDRVRGKRAVVSGARPTGRAETEVPINRSRQQPFGASAPTSPVGACPSPRALRRCEGCDDGMLDALVARTSVGRSGVMGTGTTNGDGQTDDEPALTRVENFLDCVETTRERTRRVRLIAAAVGALVAAVAFLTSVDAVHPGAARFTASAGAAVASFFVGHQR
ncbi:MAG TPA: gamma-glutamyltransferase [Labilithrix sp.]|nr:gamma-glutamyltransferase [Labilithrix sp.]